MATSRLLPLFFVPALLANASEFEIKSHYTKIEYRIPMRDGVKLYTAVYVPREYTGAPPILLTRTPYGTGPYGTENYAKSLGPLGFAEEKFIFVLQDVRGRFMSEGEFVDVRPIKPVLDDGKDTDESTDTFDTIDWLIKNVPNNNGKVGMIGTSYNAYYVNCGLIRSHPALLVSSPQAPMSDLFHGDDAYHNGAFFLLANFSFYTGFSKQKNPETGTEHSVFDYGTNDSYKFYLQMGPVADSDRLYLLNKNPYWTDLYRHSTEDSFWRVRNILPHLKAIKPAVLVVGGWYDAEDLAGSLATYRAIRKQSPATQCKLVMGPWAHGAWNHSNGDSLGDIAFGSNTSEVLRDMELRFFKQYLKDAGSAGLPDVFMFETGKNRWKPLAQWPPAVSAQKLYLQAERQLSFNPPGEQSAFDEYISDPANPVPFMPDPPQDMVKEYMVADQRFASERKDVLSYVSSPLGEDMTVAGPIVPNLVVATSGTDSDFDVKLIDVSPTGYQQLVRGEPFRGKFRNSFEQPQPFVPGKPAEIRFTMPDVYHCFQKGHRLMVQVQSSWFPLTDRNPQTFTDIPNAKREDFVAATERIYRSRKAASFIELSVERAKEEPQEPAASH